MSRYPFMQYADSVIERNTGILADITLAALRRRYAHQGRVFFQLFADGKVSTTSPKAFTAEDIRAYLAFRRSLGLSQKELVHETSALRKLLVSVDNVEALDTCFSKYPQLKKPFSGQKRLSSLSSDEYDLIVKASEGIDRSDYRTVRAYALVMLVMGTGLRTKEVRLLDVDDLDIGKWLLSIIHVKGEDTYGFARAVPIRKDIRPILSDYLDLRKKFIAFTGLRTHALFPSSQSADGYLSANTLRNIKTTVVEDCGIDFDFRKLRRTYGQLYIDHGLSIEAVSRLMGHVSTDTTETYYCRIREDASIEAAKGVWE